MMKTKATTYVRKLAVSDIFEEGSEMWVVSGTPEVKGGNEVHIKLARVTAKRRYTKTFVYDIDARVRLI